MCAPARAPYGYAHWCVRIWLYACWCGVVHLCREYTDIVCSAGERPCPRHAFVPPPLVPPALPQTCYARAGSDEHGPRSLAAHAFLSASVHERPESSGQLKDPENLLWILACGGRPATKSPFERNFRWLNEDKATAAGNGKHMRRPIRNDLDAGHKENDR